MALVKCEECQHEISTKADKCPNCGARVRNTSLVTKPILVILVFGVPFVVFGVTLAIFSLYTASGNTSAPTASSSSVTSTSRARSVTTPEAELRAQDQRIADALERLHSPESVRERALGDVKIKNFEWSKGGFDNIMMLTVTIENKGARAVKDIEITCTLSANSGTEIDRNTRVLYETIPAKKSRTFKDFNMGFIHSQAMRSGCEITDLKTL